MIQAVNGMVLEQHQVLISFVLMIFLFALQLIGMYWIMMDQISAIASTIVTLGGMYIWYHFCLRIYNRFYWDQSHGDYWQNALNEGGNISDLNELSCTSTDDPVYAITKPNVKVDEVVQQSKTKSTPLLVPLISPGTNPLNDIIEESGYLSLKVTHRFTGDSWQRRFFLLRGSLLFYYKDKSSCMTNPGKPINRRPLDLSCYTLQTSSSHSPPFELILQPSEGIS